MTAKRFKGAFCVLAAAALVALLAGCDGLFGGSSGTSGESGAESGTGSAGGQADYADVGYGPYTAISNNGGSVTAEGHPDGIHLTKQDPSPSQENTMIMICVWEAGTGADGAVYEPYHRVFYPKSGLEEPPVSINNENDFIYKFTRKDVVYGVRLITWAPNFEGVWIETQSNIVYVRAGGGIGDLRAIIYDSGYDSTEGQLWFNVEEQRPADLPRGEFWYRLTLTPENFNETSEAISSPWQKWGSAKTEITSIILENYFDEFGQNLEIDLEIPQGEPFRVDYGFMYWISENEIYQGNIMTAQKKLFNAN